jgi:hypothetical protein
MTLVVLVKSILSVYSGELIDIWSLQNLKI